MEKLNFYLTFEKKSERGRNAVTFFAKQWVDEVVLPDGTTASCAQDIDRFLRQNDLALAGDYTDAFRQRVRYQQQKTQQQADWTEFLKNYKRLIWNE